MLCAVLVLLCVVLSYYLLVRPAGPDAPTGLAVEDRVKPIGIGDSTPEFSWVVQDSRPGEIQSAYQILVAPSLDKLKAGKTDKWDSGKVGSSSVAFVSYAGKALQSREVCYWKVRTWNSNGQAGPWSKPGRFEMGLLSNEDWGVKWIWRKQKEAARHHVYFRKEVVLPNKNIVRGRVYISSVHHHNFYINGRLIGKGPNFAYPEYQYYQTFDVTSNLIPGSNVVFGLLCHWFGWGQGRPGSQCGLLFKAVVDFDDGTSMVIGSDEGWKVRPAEWIVHSEHKENFRNGEGIPSECIDGRLKPVGWNRNGYDDSGWANAVEIGTHPTEPWTGRLIVQETTITEYEISPVDVERLGEGHYVADFGKVYSGRPKITFTGGEAGTVVSIKADYRVQPDGTLKGYAQNTKMDYQYTLRGGEEMFEPFWYLGFQYLEVENAPASFDEQSICMVVRHHKVDCERSSFECSNPTLNGIFELAKRSAMLGSHESFVDTPTREQGQFTYDSYQCSMTAMKCFGERDLTQKAIREFAQSQIKYHSDTGKVNCVYPDRGKRDIPDWTQSWVFWVWDYYMETGDRELITEIFEQLIKVGQYVRNSENKETGLIDWCNEAGYASGIVDWPNRYGYDRQTTQRTVLSVNAYLDYLYISRLAEELNRSDIAERFAGYAESILSAIRQQLWDDEQNAYIDGLYADGSKSKHASQQANAMMLALNLTEGERTRGAMAAVKRARHNTAPMLIRFLIQAYGNHDEDEALMEYLLNPKGRNWAYILADGGSFTYENWRGRKETKLNEVSESHPVGAYGAVIALQEYILGVKTLSPQYARVQVRPHTGNLHFASGKIPTQRGPIFVDWQTESEAGTFSMTVKLPTNVQADIYIPKGSSLDKNVEINGSTSTGQDTGKYILFRDIGSGEHRFVR